MHRQGLDKPDLIEVRGNLSTQVLITTTDVCFPAAGGIAAVTEAQPAYEILGGRLDVFTAGSYVFTLKYGPAE